MAQAHKSKEILEYFKFKSRITVPSFIDLLNSNPNERIHWSPHDGQKKIIEAYEARVPPSAESAAMGLEFDYAFNCLIAACGRRFGKSDVAALIGAEELLIPYAKVLICSYTLDNCEVIFKKIRSIIIGLGIEVTMDRQKDMELELINGSTLRVASNDNVQSKLGTAISLLIMDEAKLFNRSLYEMVLLPMLFDYHPYSRTLLISSPQAGWFESYYKMGQSEEQKLKKYWSINLPTHTNPTIPREVLKEMEENMPRDLFEQEVLGLFTSSEGMVVREFTPECIYDDEDFPYFRDWLQGGNVVFNTIDSGYNHYFGAAWILYVEEVDHFFLFEEYQKNKTITAEHAVALKEIEAEWGIDVMIRYADPAASQQIADFTAYDLYFNKAEKSTRESVNNLNTLFFQRSAVTGKPRLLVSRKCTEAIRQLQEVQWKHGQDNQSKEQSSAGVKPFKPDTGNLKTDWDLFDAIRYGMYSFVKNNRVGVSVFEFSLGADKEEEDPYELAMKMAGWVKM